MPSGLKSQGSTAQEYALFNEIKFAYNPGGLKIDGHNTVYAIQFSDLK